MQELPQIERRTHVEAPPEKVWETIVDSEGTSGWLGGRIEPRKGGRVTLDDREVIGTVEEIDPGRSITWSWRQPDGEPSQVTIELIPAEDETEVVVTERLLTYEVTTIEPFLAGGCEMRAVLSAA